MKRKEPRKSVVRATYYHDDDNKGKQLETFCEVWKQEILPGLSVKSQKENWKKRYYLPTPPLGQDMTQGPFLSGV